MEQKRRRRVALAFALLAVLAVALFACNVGWGSVRLSPGAVWDGLLRRGEAAVVIWQLRLPRALAAALLGGALAVSGFLMQTFFANPIASPFLLGISSGARLAVALVMIGLLGRGILLSSAGMIAAAFVGAMVAMGFVLLCARRVRRSALLIVCGVMIGDICSAITDFVVAFAEDSNIINLHNWTKGSFSGIAWRDLAVLAPAVLVAAVLTFLLSKPMAAYQLGEGYAQSMGVDLRRFRLALIVLSGVLSACVAAFAGPISFVGIAVPHLVKGLLHTTRPILMIPGCLMGGAVFCLLCDLIARTVFAPTELAISSVTAVFGAPVVIAIMLRRRLRDD
ncbi:MAG: iron ABC transporter permease [Eubacteriales bacterium]|nr:iron ABC transporter permease [Eubacteriales bacterium]